MFDQQHLESLLPSGLAPAARRTYIVARRLGRRVYGTVMKRGNAVECPCCGWQGSEFLSYAGRHGVLCPRCGSYERRRFLWLNLDIFDAMQDKRHRVLHVAPEPIVSDKLRDIAGCGYIGVDLNRTDVELQMDITDNLFRDDLFDFVACSHVLEHVPDDRKAITEILRVLSPEGVALIMVPVYDLPITLEDPSVTTPEDRRRVYGQYDHVRSYGRDFRDRLGDAGFDVEVRSPDTLPKEIRQRFGVKSQDGISREDIYLCRKPRPSA